MFSHFVLVCQLLDVSYGLQLYQAVGGVVLHLVFQLWMKINIKLYCSYQYFMSINSFFNTLSLSLYSRPITNETSHVTTHATHSDPWPTLARPTSLFLICCYKNNNISHRLYSQGKHMWLLLSFWRHTSYCPQAWFAQLPAIVWKLEWEKYYRLKNICIFELHFIHTTYMVNSCIFLCKWLRSLFLYDTWSWSNGRWMLPMKSVSVSTNVVSSNPTQARGTRCNIMW